MKQPDIWKHIGAYSKHNDLVYVISFPKIKQSLLDLKSGDYRGVVVYHDDNEVQWVLVNGRRYNDVVHSVRHCELEFSYDVVKMIRVEELKEFNYKDNKNYIVLCDKHSEVSAEIYEGEVKLKRDSGYAE